MLKVASNAMKNVAVGGLRRPSYPMAAPAPSFDQLKTATRDSTGMRRSKEPSSTRQPVAKAPSSQRSHQQPKKRQPRRSSQQVYGNPLQQPRASGDKRDSVPLVWRLVNASCAKLTSMGFANDERNMRKRLHCKQMLQLIQNLSADVQRQKRAMQERKQQQQQQTATGSGGCDSPNFSRSPSPSNSTSTGRRSSSGSNSDSARRSSSSDGARRSSNSEGARRSSNSSVGGGTTSPRESQDQYCRRSSTSGASRSSSPTISLSPSPRSSVVDVDRFDSRRSQTFDMSKGMSLLEETRTSDGSDASDGSSVSSSSSSSSSSGYGSDSSSSSSGSNTKTKKKVRKDEKKKKQRDSVDDTTKTKKGFGFFRRMRKSSGVSTSALPPMDTTCAIDIEVFA